jgi:hypothetical protein
MSSEQPSPETENEDYFVAGFETFPSTEFTPVGAMRRWLANRRQRKEDLRNHDPRYYLGATATALEPVTGSGLLEAELHSPKVSDGDRFYYGPVKSQAPAPLNIAAEFPAAAALAHAQELKQEPSTQDSSG